MDFCFANVLCGTHGRCVNSLNGFTCACTFFFDGVFCEKSTSINSDRIAQTFRLPFSVWRRHTSDSGNYLYGDPRRSLHRLHISMCAEITDLSKNVRCSSLCRFVKAEGNALLTDAGTSAVVVQLNQAKKIQPLRILSSKPNRRMDRKTNAHGGRSFRVSTDPDPPPRERRQTLMEEAIDAM